jgi:membrane protease YdiL (CAAX protease family)
MKRALFYTFLFLFIQLLAGLAVDLVARLFPTLSGVMTQIISMSVFSIATIILFLSLKWTEVSMSYIKSRPWVVLLWCVVAAFGTIIPSIFLQDLLPEWPASIQQFSREAEAQIYEIVGTPGGYFVICLLAPVAEELVFRGAILRALLRWRPSQRWLMIVVSALLFALIHLNPAQMPHAFLAGLLLGWLFMRTGSVIPGIAFHWANNTITYFIARLYPDPDTQLVDIFGSQSRVLLAVGFSLLILLPALYQLNVWMKHVKQ